MLVGEGVGAHGEFEHIGVVVAHASKDVEGGLMVLFGLAAEAGDDIGGDGAVGQVAAYGIDAVQIPFARVAAVHAFQHAAAAALHGQMDILADVVVARHDLQQLVA